MKIFSFYLFFLIPLGIWAQDAFEYPQTWRYDEYDTIFEKVVNDPYRWMEEPSEELEYWIIDQEDLLNNYKRKHLKYYPRIRNDLFTYSYSKSDFLIKEGESFYFYRYMDYNTSPFLMKQPSYKSNNWVAVDHRRFHEKGEEVSIASFKVSKDEKYLAFSLSRSGSDWREIRIKNVENGKYLNDHIRWVKYSNIAWKDDGFFYWRYDLPEKGRELLSIVRNQQLYYHKVGTTQQEDKLIFEIEETDLSYSFFQVTTDEEFLILGSFEEIEGEWREVLFIKDLERNSEPERLFLSPRKDLDFTIIDHIDGKLYVCTNYQANNYQVIAIDVKSKEIVEVIPEYDQLLEQVNILSDRIVCLYYHEGKNLLSVFDLNGKPLISEQFDEGFSVSGFQGNNDDEETLYFMRSFYLPTIVYKINFREGTIELSSKTEILYDHTQFETRYVKYKSKDGTWIPMYLTFKKDTKLTSSNCPVLLYGYGGFGIPLSPSYDPGYILFLESGGVLATPQIRGGGEFGKKWHDAGKILNKQNSFDDFIAAAEFLIQTNITSPNRIAINGGSNGGLLVGAVMTQRPDLFKVAVPEMGVFDMLRFDQFGINYVHQDEFGSVADSLEFLNLLSYSPYHNIQSNKSYPATLVVTAENDDRVPPLHSYKFVSRLQENSSITPFLLNVQKRAGHYGSETLKESYDNEALKWSFIFKHLGMKPK